MVETAAPAVIGAAEIDAALDFPSLIARLRATFRDAGVAVPPRHHHALADQGGGPATLLLMPAWQEGGPIGVKVAGVFPGNAARGLPAVTGLYLLLDGDTGLPLAVLDAAALTRWRTAAASALAADFLARPDAATLVMIGTGGLAEPLIRAHAAIRPLRRALVWGRDPAKAAALAARLDRPGLRVEAASALASAVGTADIVSCATPATAPVLQGEWLAPGTHVDLVGGFTAAMREADDRVVARARLFVDTRTALAEAGDLVQPIRTGVITADACLGDLAALCRGVCGGRQSAEEITLFKSVGTALEDLAAARLVVERRQRR